MHGPQVQGLSFVEVVISFQLLKQRTWNEGQQYVALSRVKSLPGLFLTGTFDSKAIIVNEATKREYQYLRENQSIDFESEMVIPEKTVLSLVVCNVRSLRKHSCDLSADKIITCCDMILCTETQLVNSDDITDISIDGFNLVSNNDTEHRFSSLAAYYNNSIKLTEHSKMNGFSMLKISNDSIAPLKVRILLLYRKKDMNMGGLIEALRYITVAMDFDIIVGDFNSNPNTILAEVLHSYEQYVTESTHLGGSVLDHVYVRNSLLENFSVHVKMKSLFFSDHEAVRLCLTRK